VKICVCEFPDEGELKAPAWDALVAHTVMAKPDLVVLPEMPFCRWIFIGDSVDLLQWRDALEKHDVMIGRFRELACQWVASSRPVERENRRFNEAFLWSSNAGYQQVRRKWYLPDAPTARETLWFHQGDRNFGSIRCGPTSLGFQLCSEMMFPEHAREIGWTNAHLIVQPRAAGDGVRWRVASQMSALSSGCFVASANRRSYDQGWFSGESWLLTPDALSIAETSVGEPFVTIEIDVAVADHAKRTYPRDLQKRYLDPLTKKPANRQLSKDIHP